jgi:poly(3-hydroxybutyrate) depolymerase
VLKNLSQKTILYSFLSFIPFIIILIALILNCGGTSTATPDDNDDDDGVVAGETIDGDDTTVSNGTITKATMTVEGTSRSVSFFVPTDVGSSPPLVIAFHGTSGNSEEWVASGDPSGLQYLAHANGFIIAAPQSRYIDDEDWDHEGFSDYYWETAAPNGQSTATNVDLMFVQQIIASAATTYGINTNRVYSLGFSNGGFFALLTAMVLNDEIAAFAEAGSGLVTCETTRSCTAEVASSTTCSTIIASSGCSCSGSEKPITIPSSGRKVPGFLGHNNQDDTVSVYYTCYLANRLDDLGYTYEVLIGDEEGHGFPSGFLPDAWEFMSAYELP